MGLHERRPSQPPQTGSEERIQQEFPEARIFLQAAALVEQDHMDTNNGIPINPEKIDSALLIMARKTHPKMGLRLICDAYASRGITIEGARSLMPNGVLTGDLTILCACEKKSKELMETERKPSKPWGWSYNSNPRLDDEIQALAKAQEDPVAITMAEIYQRVYAGKKRTTISHLKHLALIEILRRAGKTNYQISEELGISKSTVDAYARELLQVQRIDKIPSRNRPNQDAIVRAAAIRKLAQIYTQENNGKKPGYQQHIQWAHQFGISRKRVQQIIDDLRHSP